MSRNGAIVCGLKIADMELAEIWYPAGARAPQLLLDEIEILLVVAGELAVTPTAGAVHWKSGTAVVRRLDVNTPYVAVRATRIVSVRVPTRFRNANHARLKTIDSWIRLPQAAADDLRRMRIELNMSRDSSSLRLEALALLVVDWAEQTFRQRPSNEARPRWMAATMERLSDVSHAPTLRQLADAAGVTPLHFARVFQRFEGCTVGDYHRKLRIVAACRLLQSSSTPLARVALAAGFADQAHFSKAFKRQMGMTPREFRNSVSVQAGTRPASTLGFDLSGTYPFQSTTAAGQPYEGVLEITGTTFGYGCVVRTSVMPEVVADSVAVNGQQVIMTASVPAGVAVLRVNFDGSRFSGEWRLAGNATPLSGHRAG